ncbi:MAG TPA: phage baseplate protein [Blastocatellia bacterium]|nr:phage baseplate protein [Blastocatellia bacterium]
MRRLSTSELLSVWEKAASERRSAWPITLLAAACSDQSPEDLARLSIGQRDSRLLELRERMFGPELHLLSTCEDCDARLELRVLVKTLRTVQRDQPAIPLSVKARGFHIEFRVPDSFDLDAAAELSDSVAARMLLLERCVMGATRGDARVPVSELPAEVVDAIAAGMAEADPQADIQLTMACPSCGHRWLAIFDIASCFWRELDAWAISTLKQVHTLARAYGWSERDILLMSRVRRLAYLDLVSG